ncbi:MAG: ATP-binding protein [Methanosphaera stadtmanae]|nr:ATP-binding protein [Methanosphaera stadtmanae]
MNTLPWGTNQNLTDEEFYNRQWELDNIKTFLETTGKGNAPKMLLTGIRGVGKTVFLKKIKRDMYEDYLVLYLDFSQSESYQKNNLSIRGLMEYFFKQLIIESKNKKLNTMDKRIEKYFKSNNFKIKDFIQLNKFPIPVFSSQTDTDKLFNFVLELPEKIYKENSDKIKGVIIFIDEFQIIKQLDDYMDSFLWKMRSFIQNQREVAYVFSGSMSLQDNLISEISSRDGVFGGRMLTFHLYPFEKDTVKDYLTKKAPYLIFTDDGFERFYKCTSGIPSYINIFASLLPQNTLLTEDIVIKNFDDKISAIITHLINMWTRLTYREQSIFISLLDSPLKRIEIANQLNVSTGSLSNNLNHLQNQGLIKYENEKYQIAEPILGRWLKLEFKNKGNYPYRL